MREREVGGGGGETRKKKKKIVKKKRCFSQSTEPVAEFLAKEYIN